MRLDEALQLQRLEERNPMLYERFVNEWIPLENKYFDAFNIPEKCDFILDDMEKINE